MSADIITFPEPDGLFTKRERRVPISDDSALELRPSGSALYGPHRSREAV